MAIAESTLEPRPGWSDSGVVTPAPGRLKAQTEQPHRSDVTKILLVEEHTLVRRSVRLLLDAEIDLEVCGGTSTLAEAIEGSWEPDVAIHGLLLPDGSGPEVVARMRGRFPRAGLVVLSRLDTPTYVHLAFAAGAGGYVLKSADPQDLLEAVRQVAAGHGYVQPSLGAALARWDDIPRRHDRDSLFSLTVREQEVLELLALGHTNGEVARALSVALRTVEAHRTHVTQKLGLHTRAGLVRFVSEQQRTLSRLT